MKKLATVALILGSTIATVSHAAGYGVVDMQRIVENSTYLKQQNDALQQSVKPSATRAEQLNQEIQALQEKAATAKPAEVQQLKTQYEAKVKEINGLEQSIQQRVQAASQTTSQIFTARVQQAAEQLRKENNLDVILNKNAALAYDNNSDLTDKMLQRVNTAK
ncbi:OmpH family outer membrane protein [Acinetobacter rathckeae]|uniref:OmpH family outer membrane protein n=1 Tax=Acinetobacter rathckeae TaxID=2605272 RepID=UPI0018A2CA61|nr:OmpH family outer membrane protein [Acinetobacter rathckeae]MBF7687169.1 OmpH family outer membrane protein [Acinetobacter rathckeae]MBF7694478.1 OmpH family outer membrane protein [Acinetobacter rathckeae]